MAIAVRTTTLQITTSDGELIANLDALQGTWSEAQFFKMADANNLLMEYCDGIIEVLPMPTDKHQAISRFLLLALIAFIHPRGGTVFYAPLSLQIRPGKLREPDLLFLLDADDPRRQNRYWLGADGVLEIVSQTNSEHDLWTKRIEYAQAGIPEYWIVNPDEETITVLTLENGSYTEHGVFRAGDSASSVLLPGFAVDVAAVLDAR